MPKINFTGVGKPVPTDTYACVVTKADYVAESKGSGNPAIAFQWTVNEGDYEGRTLFRSYSVQPKALIFLKKVLIALGIDPEDLEADIDIDSILTELVGTECNVVVSVGEYNGAPSNSVDDVKPAGVSVF